MNLLEAIQKQNNTYGSPACEAVKRYLENKGHKVTDVQTEKEYRNIDVDLILHTDKNILLEIKNDTYMGNKENPNVYCEWMTDVENNIPGYVQKSQADYIYYIAYQKYKSCNCHIFELADLRKWITHNKPEPKYHPDKIERKTKMTYLIPLDSIKTLKSYQQITLEQFKLN